MNSEYKEYEADEKYEECRYFLILPQDLGYASTDSILEFLDETSRFLDNYCRFVFLVFLPHH